MHQISKAEQLRQVISAEQIQKRVKEIARQISDDYRGQTIHVMALLDNGFMFMADLVRSLEVPVICQFIKPRYQKQPQDGPGEVLEIFFSHGSDIRGQHVLLIEGLIHSGVTTEFLMSDLRARGAATVKVVAGIIHRMSLAGPSAVHRRYRPCTLPSLNRWSRRHDARSLLLTASAGHAQRRSLQGCPGSGWNALTGPAPRDAGPP